VNAWDRIQHSASATSCMRPYSSPPERFRACQAGPSLELALQDRQGWPSVKATYHPENHGPEGVFIPSIGKPLGFAMRSRLFASLFAFLFLP